MLVSIIIRTLNEGKYLGELLTSINNQKKQDFEIEVVLIDSGSTDRTLEIAKDFGCKITFITKDQFTFGKSLNMGSEYANGDIFVYISGHCVPVDIDWLRKLIEPITSKKAGYCYGRQIGRDTTKYSEDKLFQKYFPDYSKIPQHDFFCNNANSAISARVWEELKFNESITGLEDMDLAKRYFLNNGKIAYVSDACVYHIHDESWLQTRRRYEREAIALQSIMPEIHIGFFDMSRYLILSIFSDCKDAITEECFWKEFISIIKFRFAQYTGTYRGNHSHRLLSKRRKENYFYPNKNFRNDL